MSSDASASYFVVLCFYRTHPKVFTPTKRKISPSSSDDEFMESDLEEEEADFKSKPNIKRRRLYYPSSSSSSSEEEMPLPSPLLFLNDDPELPVYSQITTGYGLQAIVDILMSESIPEEKICKIQPLGVNRNSTFIIDLDSVRIEDLKSDDVGSWRGNGTRRSYFSLKDNKAEFRKAIPSQIGTHYVIVRRYFVHSTYNKFRRTIVEIQDPAGRSNKYGMLQYMYDGPEVDIKVKPHGNAKASIPFFKTSKRTKERIQSLASTSTPKDVVQIITREEGGELEARGIAFLPRNRQQVANFRRSLTASQDSDVLYSIMLECKLAQGKGQVFVQDVKAAPEPQSVMFCDWQAEDLIRFCANNQKFSILTVDTTFNLGDFFVTPMTYHHLMLDHIRTGQHPIMAGPMLVHQCMKFSTFNYFAGSLIGYNKLLRNILAFGTDGDKNLVEALGHNFPHALQLRCFLHFKKNVQEKLRDLGLPKQAAQQIMDDIFGKREGNLRVEGLVDTTSVEDFKLKFELLEEHWENIESPHAGEKGPQFYSYFKRYQADVVCNHMRKDIRQVAGLGSPPAIFTTNSSEAINSVLKKGVGYKKTQWPEFVQHMKVLVEAQHNEIIRALSGRGQYRLSEDYQYLGVSMEEWNKMRPDQRKTIVQKFDSAQLKSSGSCILPYSTSTNAASGTSYTAVSMHGKDASMDTSFDQSTSYSGVYDHGTWSQSGSQSQISSNHLSIGAEDSGIHTIPLITLQSIWSKAESLLQGDNNITPLPGADRTARAVLSYRSDTPHTVRAKGNGQFTCDSSCPQWVSSKICSHIIAVANLSNSLQEFLNWYGSCAPQLNITSLAMSGMPSGRGKKKNQARKCRKKSTRLAPPDTFIASPSSLLSPVSTAMPVHQPAGPATSQVLQPAVAGATSLVVVGQSNSYTQQSSGSSVNYSFPSPAMQPQVTGMTTGNPNPFYIKFITGNIRTCQGCRDSLRIGNGMIPLPPHNLAIARAERCQFRNVSGTLITPRKESNAHYHCRLECVRAVEPNFVPFNLRLPSDVHSQLKPVHKEYLSKVFGLGL